jgi:hypothetical protein
MCPYYFNVTFNHMGSFGHLVLWIFFSIASKEKMIYMELKYPVLQSVCMNACVYVCPLTI